MPVKPKVVVCGAGGFVGSHFVEYLLQQGYEDIRAVSSRPVEQWIKKFDARVQSLQFDLRNPYYCAGAVSDYDEVYNFAAKVGGIGYIGKEKRDCLLSSLINTNLLVAAERAGIKRYFYASSACVYGSSAVDGTRVIPIKESDPVFPSAGYGEEKLFGEKMCAAFADRMAIRVARFTGIYGPGDDIKGAEDRDHVPAAICRKVIQAKISGDHTIKIWGDGRQVRDFLFIDDCVRATYGLMQSNKTDCMPTNVGSFDAVTVDHVVDVAEIFAGIKMERVYDTFAPQGVRYRQLDNTRLRSILGWEPQTHFVDGLRKVYDDINNHYIEV